MLSASVAPGCAAIGFVVAKALRRKPIGSIESRITPPTMVIGMSRSVMSSEALPSARRARFAASAATIPRKIGPITLSRVQMAATPIVPAPTKRTFSVNAVPTKSASAMPAGGPPAV